MSKDTDLFRFDAVRGLVGAKLREADRLRTAESLLSSVTQILVDELGAEPAAEKLELAARTLRLEAGR